MDLFELQENWSRHHFLRNLQVLERHLITCNTSNEMESEVKSNLLIQILGALRNLCDIPATEKLLREMSVCEQLQYTMTHHYNDSEVLVHLNIRDIFMLFRNKTILV